MDELRAGIMEFLKGLLTTILGFFKGTEVELTEEQLEGIKNFVNLIFVL